MQSRDMYTLTVVVFVLLVTALTALCLMPQFIKQASDRSSVSGGDGAVMASHGRDDGTASLPPPGSSSLQEDLYSTGTFQSHQLYGDGRPRTTASSSSGSSSSDGRHHVPSVLSSSYDASGYRALDHARQQYQPAGTAPAASHLPRDQYGAFPHSRNISVQAYRSGEKGTAHDVPVAQQRYTQWPASVQEPLVVERGKSVGSTLSHSKGRSNCLHQLSFSVELSWR